jgi:hypothetical protein
MADSDGEYRGGSSDDEPVRRTGNQKDEARRNTRSAASGPRARWEGSLQERNAADGFGGAMQTAEDLKRAIEARKRARYVF